MSWKWIVLSVLWAFGSLALKAQYGNTSNTDSLKDILKQDIYFKTRYQTLKLLSKKENNRIAALNFALTAKNIAIDFKYPYDPDFEINLGGLYLANNRYLQANQTYKKLLLQSCGTCQYRKQAEIYLQLAKTYCGMSQIDSAFICYEQAIRLSGKINDDSLKHAAYYQTGLFYLAQTRNIAAANEMAFKSLEYANKTKLTQLIVQSTDLISKVKIRENQPLLALQYSSMLLDSLEKSSQYPLQKISLYNNMGHVFRELNEPVKSIHYYQKSLALATQINDFGWCYTITHNIGTMHFDNKNFGEALKYFGMQLIYAEKSGIIQYIANAHYNLSLAFQEVHDYKNANIHITKLMQYDAQLRQAEFQTKILEINLETGIKNKERELELLKQTVKLKETKLQRNRYMLIGLAIIAGLFSSLMLVYFRFQKVKTRQIIQELNHRNLRQQMNPHFVFNTLNAIQFLLFQNKKLEANQYLSTFAALMRKTLDNSQHQFIVLQDELDSLKLYLELESLRFKEKLKYEIEIDNTIDPFDIKIPAMIIQPYVENAICHGLLNKEDNGKLSIKINSNKNALHCVIQDNGVGRAQAEKINHQNNKNYNSLGSNITESRLKLLSDLYGNKFTVKITDLNDATNEPCGTRVEITFPIIN